MTTGLLKFVRTSLNTLDFSQRTKLAEETGVGIRTIGYIRCGKTTDPRISTLERLAEQLRLLS